MQRPCGASVGHGGRGMGAQHPMSTLDLSLARSNLRRSKINKEK